MKISVLFVLLTLSFFSLKGIKVEENTCEYLVNPLAIQTYSPKLGWVLKSDLKLDKQTGYEILVASSLQILNGNKGDVWQTGKVKSNQSQHIVFNGNQLKAGNRYFWKVRVWDAKGKVSEWSNIAHFDMGLFTESDWQAQWIGAIRKDDAKLPTGRNHHKWGMPKSQRAQWDSVAPLAKRSILLRKEFSAQPSVKRAMVYVSGLGHYELMLNGAKIGNSQFAPLWTDYDKTVYYNTYDVTELLENGKNAIGVLLGNGMFNVTGNRYTKFWGSFGPPTLKLHLKIEYLDNRVEVITSNNTWKYAESPITFNCIFGGEDYDATLEQEGWSRSGFNDAHWFSVVLQQGPSGNLTAQLAPPVKVMEQFDVKEVLHSKPGHVLFDMGQNLSGFPSIKVKGKKGQTVKLWVGELTRGDTAITQSQSGGPHYYQYTLKGDGVEEWQPRFSYYGYQFIQVEGANYKDVAYADGLPELLDIKSLFLYASAPQVGVFQSSNDMFNKVHWLINNAIKSNMHSVFTDCPHREKLGWLEQTHLVGPGVMFNYDVANLYRKVQNDMMDGQLSDGLVPSINPEYTQFSGGFRDSPEWGGSIVINPWLFYEFYGDASLIKESYPAMKRYFEYLVTKADSGILSHGLGDWYDYGVHRAGVSMNTPVALSATAYFYHIAQLIEKSALFLGNASDAKYFNNWSTTIYNAFNQKFFNSHTKQYGTGSQVSNAMALYFGLVSNNHYEAVLSNLVADIISRGNRLTSGDVGNRYLFQVLANNGLNELMYAMHNHYDVPGYGFQLQFGVTTLTENWDPRQGASWNHFMMGQIEEWFFKSLAGIKPDLKSPGFKHFFIEPAFINDLKWVNASTQTPYGSIAVSWSKEGNDVDLSASVPVNTTATIVFADVNAATLKLNGKLVWKCKKCKVVRNGNLLMITIGSGKHLFSAYKTN